MPDRAADQDLVPKSTHEVEEGEQDKRRTGLWGQWGRAHAARQSSIRWVARGECGEGNATGKVTHLQTTIVWFTLILKRNRWNGFEFDGGNSQNHEIINKKYLIFNRINYRTISCSVFFGNGNSVLILINFGSFNKMKKIEI